MSSQRCHKGTWWGLGLWCHWVFMSGSVTLQQGSVTTKVHMDVCGLGCHLVGVVGLGKWAHTLQELQVHLPEGMRV